MFPFRGHLPQNLKSKIGQPGTSLIAGYRSWDALQKDTVDSTLYSKGQGVSDETPLMQIWDPHIISETTGARKLKVKTQLDVVKFSLRVQ